MENNGFDRFWAKYPRRVGKLAAIKAYGKALRFATPEDILAGVDNYNAHRTEQVQFIAHPATWLNAGRWLDEYDETPTARAQAFIGRYKAMHVRLRRGAFYIGNPQADIQEALQLVGVFDDATLDKLAYVWLNTDHPFAESGTRTLAKFRSMASWCQEQVIQWEQDKGELVVGA